MPRTNGLLGEDAGAVQSELARFEVGVQTITPLAPPVERPEQPFLGDLKRRGMDLAGPDGGVDVAVIVGADHVDVELTRMQLDVFVALDALYGELARGEPDVQVGTRRHVDADFEVVLRTVGRHPGFGAPHCNPVVDLVQPPRVFDVPIQADAVVGRTDDLVFAGRQVHRDAASGGKLPFEARRRWARLCRRGRDEDRRDERGGGWHAHQATSWWFEVTDEGRCPEVP